MSLNATDYFFMEHTNTDSKSIKLGDKTAWLFNVEDRKYANFYQLWRYPDNNVLFSRNITIANRKILDVTTVIDKRNEIEKNVENYIKKG
jgi:hypothetical protein